MSNDDVPDGFKMTEIGVIPQEWSVSTIGEHCDVITGGTPRTDREEYYDPAEVPWIKSGEVNKGIITQAETFISKMGLENSNARILPRDSVVIALAGRGKTRGTTAVLQMECACNQSVACMVPNPKELDYRFLQYYLKSRYDSIRNLTGDEDRSGLNLALIRQIKMLIPPLLEQRRIATTLSTIHEARVRTDAAISALKELKKSLMKHLFTYGPVSLKAIDEVPLREARIGPIPEGWQLGRFGEVAEIRCGQVDPREEPYASMANVGPENIESETGRLLGIRTASETKAISGKYRFSNKDILYSKIRPYLRKVALPDFDGICSADMYPVKPKTSSLERSYLFCYMLSPQFTSQATSHQNRTGIPKINREQLNSIVVAIPPRCEQRKISNSLLAVDRSISASIEIIETTETLQSTLLDRLMTGKLRIGNLEVPI